MIEKPDCIYGYTVGQLEEMLRGSKLNDFLTNTAGQPRVICDRRIYDFELQKYVDSGCGPHGVVYYPVDVQRYIFSQVKEAV